MIVKIDNPLIQCELKFAKGNTGEFEGYGSVFNSVDRGGDTIFPGAFAESLEKEMPVMFVNHQHDGIPPGDWLKAEEDSTGLFMAGKIDMNHHLGPSLHSAMKRKAMKGLSIGALRATLDYEKNDKGGKDIKNVPDLKEVSIVTFPMEESAQITAVKSEILTIESLKEAELFLRDSGYSRSSATAFVSRLRDLIQRDTGDQLDDEITKLKKDQQISVNTQKLVDFINNM